MVWSSSSSLDGAMMVTSWSRARSWSARWRTCSLTPPGCTKSYGETRQSLSLEVTAPPPPGASPRRRSRARASGVVGDLRVAGGDHLAPGADQRDRHDGRPGADGDLHHPQRDGRELAE